MPSPHPSPPAPGKVGVRVGNGGEPDGARGGGCATSTATVPRGSVWWTPGSHPTLPAWRLKPGSGPGSRSPRAPADTPCYPQRQPCQPLPLGCLQTSCTPPVWRKGQRVRGSGSLACPVQALHKHQRYLCQGASPARAQEAPASCLSSPNNSTWSWALPGKAKGTQQRRPSWAGLLTPEARLLPPRWDPNSGVP